MIELPELTVEFKELFPFMKDEAKEVRINTRETPLESPDPKDEKPYPKHDQDIPLIAICLNLEIMSEEMINLYKQNEDNKTDDIDLG